jgi:alkylated DNA repair protein alkB homolog 6
LHFINFYLFQIPPTAFYVPEFVTISEEKNILSNIYSSPKPKWTQLSNRRLQNWGGIPHAKGMIAESIPQWLDVYLERISRLDLMNGKKPNHILVNEYLPGQGIMPHFDGSLFYPTITTISLDSHIILKFLKPVEDEENNKISMTLIFSLLLEPRSLLVLQDQLFSKYLHCIEEVSEDVLDKSVANLSMCSDKYAEGTTVSRDTRISLTIRHVPKTTSFKLNIGIKR